MNNSMTQRRRSEEVQPLDRVRLTPAKAKLESPTPSNPLDSARLERLGRTAKRALTAAHGSGMAAAIEVGVDQSQLNRQLAMGTFDLRGLAAGGDRALALFGEFLVEEFGAAKKSKKQLAIERIPELLALMLVAVTEAE